MDSPPGSGRACPSCSAPAQSSQRWCLECGAELPQSRRAGLRPAVGIATTLAVLVTAASAGGYTLLRSDRQPPPPPTTVAQAPPAATTPLQPATQEPSTSSYAPAPTNPLPLPSSSSSTSGGTATPANTTVTTPTTHGTQKSGGAGYHAGTGAQPGDGTTTAQKPQLALANIALGAAAVVYAPYTASNVDLGDASKVVDGSTRTVWKTPQQTDPTAEPQVGVYVDLASSQTLRTLVIDTPAPGMSVEIYAATKGPPAAITDSGWTHVATRRDLAKQTKIGFPKTPFRYVLVWVTGLPQGATHATLSELSLLSVQPE
jgi:hypothetical protein